MRRALGCIAALVLPVLTGACTSEPTVGPGETDVARATVIVERGGPWEEVPVDPRPGARPEASAPAAPRTPPPAERPPARPARPQAPPLPVPDRRVTAEPAPLGTKPALAPEEAARRRHLDNPTRICAARITFYCPRRFAGAARLTGDDVRTTAPGRRMATGHARLVCRELHLEADRIVLRVRDDPDVQVTARGNVSFVTERRGRVVREDGARSLLVTNDQVTPLR